MQEKERWKRYFRGAEMMLGGEQQDPSWKPQAYQNGHVGKLPILATLVSHPS